LTKTRADWCEEIGESWQQQLTSILRTGKLLHEAKAAVKHGDWVSMLRYGLPFKERTAQRLMKIARDSRLTNPAHGPFLPPSWRTLYELTRLTDDQFQLALTKGAIHPEMDRADALFISKLRLPGTGKSNARTSQLSGARNAYLAECQELPDKALAAELRIVTAALTATPAEKLTRRRHRQCEAEEHKVNQAKTIAALRLVAS